MSDIERLQLVAPPPLVKKGSGTPVQWNQLEGDFDLVFPNAFKQLLAAYGSGRFANFFGVVSPFYTSPRNIGFREFVRLRTRDMADVRLSYPKTAVSLPIYPQKDGLFPWGYTDNGDTMCWLTEGDSSRWPIICLERGYLNNFDRFELSIVKFIENWLTGKIDVPTLTPPGFFPLRTPVFVAD